MSQALYRKYRSRKLSEIVGQQHITNTLQSALDKGQISHAYLLTGPRGTGKTSIARILAHEINGLPYNSDTTHLDIIEIDAASNRRIDEIRDLREKAMLAPTSAKYKVYIIDEVHMLTKEAFNALLKTLEEPPSHVVFILATTELHKLPETIISRTQRFGLKPISTNDLTSHLRDIAEKESIDVTDEALERIAGHANGGFRDAISMLDQLRGTQGQITAETVADAIGLPASETLNSIIAAVENSDGGIALDILADVLAQGYNAGTVANQLIQFARDRVLSGGNQDSLLPFLEAVLQSTVSTNQRIALELALMKSVPFKQLAESKQTKIIEEQPITKPDSKPKSVSPTPKENKKPKPDLKIEKQENTDSLWDDTLNAIKGNHNTLYGILRMAETTVNPADETITLAFRFPFHMKRASEPKHQQAITETIKSLTGKDFRLLFNKGTSESKEIKKTAKKAAEQTPVKAEKPSGNDPLDTVISLFGGGEVMK